MTGLLSKDPFDAHCAYFVFRSWPFSSACTYKTFSSACSLPGSNAKIRSGETGLGGDVIANFKHGQAL